MQAIITESSTRQVPPRASKQIITRARMHATDNNGEDFEEPLRSFLIDESVPRGVGVGVALRDVVVVLLSRRAPNHQHYH